MSQNLQSVNLNLHIPVWAASLCIFPKVSACMSHPAPYQTGSLMITCLFSSCNSHPQMWSPSQACGMMLRQPTRAKSYISLNTSCPIWQVQQENLCTANPPISQRLASLCFEMFYVRRFKQKHCIHNIFRRNVYIQSSITKTTERQI